MTDITDQDRRAAYKWAASIDPEMECWSDSARAVARVILATVDAPEPTLAEELRSIREWVDWEACSGFDEIVARAEQIEEERDEARAEVERLASGRPARIIDQAECLDRFQVGTVGRTAQTLEAWELDVYGWNSTNRTGGFASKDIIDRFGPMTILYDPEEKEEEA